MDKQARTGGAALAVVEEDGIGAAWNGDFQVGIRKNDIGRLTAQFERNLFQISRGSLHNQLAHFSRASERDFVDIGVGS